MIHIRDKNDIYSLISMKKVEDVKLDKSKLELAMADKCYSKTRLVANAGICYSSLIKLLNGRMKLTPQTLGKIAKTLEVKPKDLLKDED